MFRRVVGRAGDRRVRPAAPDRGEDGRARAVVVAGRVAREQAGAGVRLPVGLVLVAGLAVDGRPASADRIDPDPGEVRPGAGAEPVHVDGETSGGDVVVEGVL